MSRTAYRAAALLLTLALVGAVTACGGNENGAETISSTAQEGTFVGELEGTNAYIALISDGERVAGYVCDDDSLAQWIGSTPLDGSAVELVARDGSALGEATLTDEGATGEITVEDETHAFSLEPAEGEAGLYRGTVGTLGEPGSAEAGLIRLADGSHRGATILTGAGGGKTTQFINRTEENAVDTPLGNITLSKVTTGFINIDDEN